jgi:nicotinate-nucleotide adenylyltransferase
VVEGTGQRIGVFGGTFDPIHVGHLVLAVNVRHALDLDRLLLVVANQPWQKLGTRAITPAEDRYAMVEAAVEDVEGLEASRLELDRGGLSFTADTLADLAASEPDADLFLVLGSDSATGLPTWERADEVRDRTTVVVVGRPGAEGEVTLPGWHCVRVPMPLLEISSSDLRARFADGRPVQFLITEPVLRCIRARNLYGTT